MIFHCSKCKFDHAGECKVYSGASAVIVVDGKRIKPFGPRIHLDPDDVSHLPPFVQQMIESLTAIGWKNVRFEDPYIKGDIQLQQPITFIPFTFELSRTE